MPLWSKKEIEFLLNNYKTSESEFLSKKLKRSWIAIKSKASKLKIKRVSNNIEILLNDTNISSYWLGFLLADGHFSKSKFELKLKLSIKDSTHLLNFAKYISCKNITYIIFKNRKYIKLSVSNCIIIPKIIAKFDINSNKTYAPPNICDFNLSNEALLSLIIGYIDGDGCIMKQGTIKKPLNTCSIAIKCHYSWLENLRYLEKMTYSILQEKFKKSLTGINNAGLAYLTFYRHSLLKKIKQKASLYQLPVLNRKWDKINLSFNAVEPIPIIINNKLYVSKKEAARNLNVAPVTIRRWLVNNKAKIA